METKEIIKSNVLIAQFMGALYNKHSKMYGLGNARFADIGEKKNVVWAEKHFRAEDLNYNSSYDWIMPVVAKCLEGEAEQEPEISNTLIQSIYDALCNIDINELFLAVVEYIKWFNEPKTMAEFEATINTQQEELENGGFKPL